jgi:phosphopantothenoylcysteine decarboxylase/phosphopantothenate--cysteine ligase
VQEAVAKLRSRGDLVFPVDGGTLACGEVGEGKLLEIHALVDFMVAAHEQKKMGAALKDRKILISAGHTEEPLDSVRFIANRSSGKTALALARAFWVQGAEVTLVTGAGLIVPSGFGSVSAPTSAQMRASLLNLAPEFDGIIMCAAIADFVPAETAGGKWKGSRDKKSLDLKPFPNILAELGAGKKSDQCLVGFALETESALEHARAKMRDRNCDFMVVNQPTLTLDGGFGTHFIQAAILTADSADNSEITRWSKDALAAAIVEKVAQKFSMRASER